MSEEKLGDMLKINNALTRPPIAQNRSKVLGALEQMKILKSGALGQVRGLTPRVRGTASIEDFYASKEANRMSLMQSIAAANRKIQIK